MAKKQEKEIERWVTVNGARVPIFKDGSVGGPKEIRELITGKKATKAKKNIDKPQNELTDKQKKTLAKKELKKHPNDSKTGLLKHKAGEDKKSGSKERLSVYERQLAEVNDELANAPKSKALRNEEGIRELEKKKAQLEGYIAKEKGTKKSVKDNDIKEKQIARNKAEADERNGKNKESYEPYEPQDAEEWAQDLYESDNYVGDEHIEEQLERELHGTEGAKRYDIEDYEVIRNEDGGRYGDVKVRYALEFEDGLEHREGVYRLRVRDLPAGSKEEEAYKARIARKKKEAKANMSPRAKASQKKKNETVEQAMDRLQKESRAKVDSMSAQQVMKYAKENGLRGLKTDTLAQRDDRVANHMYMQEMKKWRAQKAQNEFNKQDLKDTKAYERQQKKTKEAREAEERRREREFGSWMANKDDKSLAHSHRDVMKKYGMGSKEHQAFIEEMRQRGFQYIDGVWRKVRK